MKSRGSAQASFLKILTYFSYEQHEVAYDGKLGYHLFSANDFDLVILDINLPGINGYELCKIIGERNQEIPVIVLTSMSALKDKIEGYE